MQTENEIHERHRNWMDDWWDRQYQRSLTLVVRFIQQEKRKAYARRVGAYGAEQLELNLTAEDSQGGDSDEN